MGKHITIGGYEFTLEKPSEAAYDASIDLSRQDREKGRGVLFASCVSSPSQTELSRIFSVKPAIKRILLRELENMAGARQPFVRLEADPEKPNLVRWLIGDLAVAFKPADEAQYDAFEVGASRSLSDASHSLVQSCVKEPEGIAALFAETPALKHGIASLIVDEAGMGLEVIEKKPVPPSDPS